MEILKFIYLLPRNLLCVAIRGYQKTLSPDHGWFKVLYPHGYCKFSPTCSSYAHDVIKERGVIVGVAKATWRVLRCNPWSDGGYDPPGSKS